MLTRRSVGSVTRHSETSWRVRLDAGRGSDGKTVRLSKVVRGTKKDAEMELALLMLHAGKGTTSLKQLTVAEFVEAAWLPTKSELRPSTIKGYESTIRNYIRPLFDAVKLSGLRSFVIDQKLKEIEAPGARLNVYKILSNAMELAAKSGMVDGDPMFGVTRPKLPGYSADTYTVDEVSALLEYVHGDDLEPAVLIAVMCGLRRSELAALDWVDLKIDGGKAELTVKQGYHGQRYGYAAPKTARSARSVALPTIAANRLREIRGENVVRLGPLLVDRNGCRMSPDGITARWRTLMGQECREGETALHTPPVRYIPWKNLRHTHATLALSSGVDVVSVSRRLGHASVSTTDAYYLRPGRSADEAAADSFSGLFSKDQSRRGKGSVS